MPLYRRDDRLVYFAHIPKCAGSTVSTYLTHRLGRPTFENRKFLRMPKRERWSRTSPQHIPADALAEFIPPETIDIRFAIVRHPEDRIRSVYAFQRDHQKRIPRWLPFWVWVRLIPLFLKYRPYGFDGHLLPQRTFVTDKTRVFKLEDGLDDLVAFLDEQFGPSDDVHLGHEKKSRWQKTLSPADARIVARIYADDYAAFGYSPSV